MYTIDVYFINQTQDGPYKTFTCDDAKLPETLKLVRTFVYSVLAEASKSEVRYKSCQSLYLVEPKFMTAVSKVVVNGNEFPGIPNLAQIAQMPGHNPLIKQQLLNLLENYPTVQAIGFDGHTADCKGISGDITIHATGDKEAVYNLANSLRNLYNSGVDDLSNQNLVCCVFSGIDTGYLELLKRGVDF